MLFLLIICILIVDFTTSLSAEDNGPQPIATIGGLSNMDSHRPVTHAMQDHHHGMDEEYDGVIHEMIMRYIISILYIIYQQIL